MQHDRHEKAPVVRQHTGAGDYFAPAEEHFEKYFYRSTRL